MKREKAEAVKAAVAGYFKDIGQEVPDDQLRLFDHNHEGLSAGSWSLACEGWLDYDWPWYFGEAVYEGKVKGLPEGVFTEPVNGCVLGIHDNNH
jgi:hypothetical protein